MQDNQMETTELQPGDKVVIKKEGHFCNNHFAVIESIDGDNVIVNWRKLTLQEDEFYNVHRTSFEEEKGCWEKKYIQKLSSRPEVLPEYDDNLRVGDILEVSLQYHDKTWWNLYKGLQWKVLNIDNNGYVNFRCLSKRNLNNELVPFYERNATLRQNDLLQWILVKKGPEATGKLIEAKMEYYIQRYKDEEGGGWTLHSSTDQIKPFFEENSDGDQIIGSATKLPIELVSKSPFNIELEFQNSVWGFQLAEDYPEYYKLIEEFLNKKDAQMSENGDNGQFMDRAKLQMKGIGKAAAQGFAFATADQTGNLLLKFASKLVPKYPWLQAMLDDEMGREFLKVILSIALNSAAHHTRFVPKKDQVIKATELQISMSSYKVINPLLGELMGLVAELANLGENIEDATSGYSLPENAENKEDIVFELDNIKEVALK